MSANRKAQAKNLKLNLSSANSSTQEIQPATENEMSFEDKLRTFETLKADDLETIKELGSGNGGTVYKVRHKTTNEIMARKVKY
jgi:mitogen-activated protein kinase kinase